MTWSFPSCKGTSPCPRWGHSTVQGIHLDYFMVIMVTNILLVGTQLVIFGGHDGLNRLGDIHIFDTGNNP